MKQVIYGKYPDAIFLEKYPKLKTIYGFGIWPKILIVHHTAGWQNSSGEKFMKYFLKRGLCTDFMDQYGQAYQQRDGNSGGHHVGKSEYMGKTKISQYAAGIEIAGGGKLIKKKDKYFTWYKKEVKPENVRTVKTSCGYVVAGHYEKFTDAQEKSLAKYLIWQMDQGVELILGHDEVVKKGRKNDPGGSLSMPLYKFVTEKVLPHVSRELERDFSL